jgi:LasA protease
MLFGFFPIVSVYKPSSKFGLILLMAVSMVLSACQPEPAPVALAMQDGAQAEEVPAEEAQVQEMAEVTPFPTRPAYQPAELVDYTVQTGDTLPALAVHFNTQVEEIREANPIIPEDVTTLPPGMPMKIPIYYAPLWGSQFQILPDSLFINGPAQVDFDVRAFLDGTPGWFKHYVVFATGANRDAAESIEMIAENFSVSPRLLLALLEYHSGALSQPGAPAGGQDYLFGVRDSKYRGAYMQLVWAANTLNNSYYKWRKGELKTIVHKDGTTERPDPWQNTATVALQDYFSRLLPTDEYFQAIGPDGFAQTYANLFGDPWAADEPHIPGSLVQPELRLPFEPGTTWAFTGGPHTGWGTGEPLAALDFAPPSVVGGCTWTDEWATAVAPGVVTRSEPGLVMLDLDMDGDERTGWVMVYLHIGTEGRAPVGVELETGDPVGHPSCEGGKSTGTHVHIARKYNGEWIMAEGPLAFNLEGWIAHNGSAPYFGTMTRFGKTITACVCSNGASFITSDERQE